eukprot:TRINITY_DN21399_c0_g1_i4.p1 TRINITY_DN21399_c0_g1~~TRINITY_DN21399_c0_g1_i4.p1  ORF type:complete len:912 (-),score=161.87 TRINITY_DN21399_c0_g1_i4:63-2798(-)
MSRTETVEEWIRETLLDAERIHADQSHQRSDTELLEVLGRRRQEVEAKGSEYTKEPVGSPAASDESRCSSRRSSKVSSSIAAKPVSEPKREPARMEGIALQQKTEPPPRRRGTLERTYDDLDWGAVCGLSPPAFGDAVSSTSAPTSGEVHARRSSLPAVAFTSPASKLVGSHVPAFASQEVEARLPGKQSTVKSGHQDAAVSTTADDTPCSGQPSLSSRSEKAAPVAPGIPRRQRLPFRSKSEKAVASKSDRVGKDAAAKPEKETSAEIESLKRRLQKLELQLTEETKANDAVGAEGKRPSSRAPDAAQESPGEALGQPQSASAREYPLQRPEAPRQASAARIPPLPPLSPLAPASAAPAASPCLPAKDVKEQQQLKVQGCTPAICIEDSEGSLDDLRQKPVEHWHEADVIRWLLDISSFPRDMTKVVVDNAITGVVLLSLTEKDLDFLKVEKFGHRRMLTIAAELLRSSSGGQEQPGHDAREDAEEEAEVARPGEVLQEEKECAEQPIPFKDVQRSKRQGSKPMSDIDLPLEQGEEDRRRRGSASSDVETVVESESAGAQNSWRSAVVDSVPQARTVCILPPGAADIRGEGRPGQAAEEPGYPSSPCPEALLRPPPVASDSWPCVAAPAAAPASAAMLSNWTETAIVATRDAMHDVQTIQPSTPQAQKEVHVEPVVAQVHPQLFLGCGTGTVDRNTVPSVTRSRSFGACQMGLRSPGASPHWGGSARLLASNRSGFASPPLPVAAVVSSASTAPLVASQPIARSSSTGTCGQRTCRSPPPGTARTCGTSPSGCQPSSGPAVWQSPPRPPWVQMPVMVQAAPVSAAAEGRLRSLSPSPFVTLQPQPALQRPRSRGAGCRAQQAYHPQQCCASLGDSAPQWRGLPMPRTPEAISSAAPAPCPGKTPQQIVRL